MKELIELLAATLSICVSIMVLGGVLIAHKKGFLKAIHHIALHHHKLLLEAEKKKRSK